MGQTDAKVRNLFFNTFDLDAHFLTVARRFVISPPTSTNPKGS